MTSPQIWRTLLPLFVAAFLAFSYNNIFMSITPLYALSCSLSAFEAGTQTTIFLAVAIALRFVFGALADRIGTKPVMICGMLSFVIGAFVFVGSSSFASIIAARCIQAIGLASFWSCATTTVCNVSPIDKNGWYLGLYRFITSASLLLGPVLAFKLIELISYQICFVALGTSAFLALIALVAMPAVSASGHTSSDNSHNVSPDASSNIPPDTSHNIPSDTLYNVSSSWRARLKPFLSNKTLWFIVVCTLCAAMSYGLVFSFAGTYLNACEETLNTGIYFTILGAGGLVGNPLAGWLSDRMNIRLSISLWLGCIGFGVLSLAYAPNNFFVLLTSGTLVGLGYAGNITASQSLTSSCMHIAHRATAFAIQQNAIDLGIALASSLFGLAFSMAGTASSLPFVIQGTIVMLAGICALTLQVRYTRR